MKMNPLKFAFIVEGVGFYLFELNGTIFKDVEKSLACGILLRLINRTVCGNQYKGKLANFFSQFSVSTPFVTRIYYIFASSSLSRFSPLYYPDPAFCGHKNISKFGISFSSNSKKSRNSYNSEMIFQSNTTQREALESLRASKIPFLSIFRIGMQNSLLIYLGDVSVPISSLSFARAFSYIVGIVMLTKLIFPRPLSRLYNFFKFLMHLKGSKLHDSLFPIYSALKPTE